MCCGVWGHSNCKERDYVYTEQSLFAPVFVSVFVFSAGTYTLKSQCELACLTVSRIKVWKNYIVVFSLLATCLVVHRVSHFVGSHLKSQMPTAACLCQAGSSSLNPRPHKQNSAVNWGICQVPGDSLRVRSLPFSLSLPRSGALEHQEDILFFEVPVLLTEGSEVHGKIIYSNSLCL